ncbi:MAG: phosphoribosylanthranilate isomerase [Deltaproteobacteria bacterium]|nr:phosphoribosylanthranilate isomerase [Deltaproteobacteria bacterium]
MLDKLPPWLLKFVPGKPLIKVCGLKDPEEAILAGHLGADMCGFIFEKSSPRYVLPSVVRGLPTLGALRVGVFTSHDPQEIAETATEAHLDLIQLHGDQGPQVAKILGPSRVIKVFWPDKYNHESLEDYQNSSSDHSQSLEKLTSTPLELETHFKLWRDLAGLFLFDSGSSGGGHGRKVLSIPWFSPRPFMLAGGIKPDDPILLWPQRGPNLVGFDLNSCLESAPGRKDSIIMKRFFERLRFEGRKRRKAERSKAEADF